MTVELDKAMKELGAQGIKIPPQPTGTLVAILQLAIHFYQRISRVDNPLWPKVCIPVMAELGLHLDFEQEYFEEISERFLEGR